MFQIQTRNFAFLNFLIVVLSRKNPKILVPKGPKTVGDKDFGHWPPGTGKLFLDTKKILGTMKILLVPNKKVPLEDKDQNPCPQGGGRIKCENDTTILLPREFHDFGRQKKRLPLKNLLTIWGSTRKPSFSPFEWIPILWTNSKDISSF